MKIIKISFLFIFLTLNFLSTCSETDKKRKHSDIESDIETETNKKIKLDPKEQQDLNDRFINAAKYGFFDLMKKLHQDGAEIDAIHSYKKRTALMEASDLGQIEVFNYLITNNANVNIVYRDSCDGMHTALSDALNISTINTCVEKFKIATMLIQNPNLIINITLYTTPWQNRTCYLTYCCESYIYHGNKSYLDLIYLLLQYGANPITPKGANNRTFLDHVSKNPEIEEIYIQELLDRHLPCMPKELNALIVSYVKEPSVNQLRKLIIQTKNGKPYEN